MPFMECISFINRFSIFYSTHIYHITISHCSSKRSYLRIREIFKYRKSIRMCAWGFIGTAFSRLANYNDMFYFYLFLCVGPILSDFSTINFQINKRADKFKILLETKKNWFSCSYLLAADILMDATLDKKFKTYCAQIMNKIECWTSV